MSRFLFTSLCLFLVVGMVVAKEQKVGYIDLEYIIQNYRTASDAQRAFETEIAKYKTYADSLKQMYDVAQAEFESQKLMLSTEGQAAKQIEISRLKSQYDDYLTEAWGKGGKIELKNRELIAPVNQKIQAAIQQIAVKDGFTMILDASQSKIVYAQPDLDLTDKILQELNKEYEATIVPATEKGSEKDIVYIAIFPFFEENQEAQQEHIGETIRSDIYDLIKNAPKIRMVSNSDINNALLTRSLSLNGQISDMDANSIGMMLQADYLVIGSISKQGNRVSYSVKVLEPLNSKTIYQGTGDAPRIEELKQSLGDQVQQAILKMKPQDTKSGK